MVPQSLDVERPLQLQEGLGAFPSAGAQGTVGDPCREWGVAAMHKWKRTSRFKKKRRGAVDLGSPVYGNHVELQAAPALEGTLVGGAVWLECSQAEKERLDRGCFGKAVVGEQAAGYFLGRAPSSPAVSSAVASTLVQLSFEEAFYLVWCLGCLEVFDQKCSEEAPDGGHTATRRQLGEKECWHEFRKRRKSFLPHFVAFRHLRSLGWLARPGLQYGATFVLYSRHLSLVHSDYCVRVVPSYGQSSYSPGPHKDQQLRWLEVQALGRLCEQVAKGLLLLYVVQTGEDREVRPPCDDASEDPEDVLSLLRVEIVEVTRFLAEKNRCYGAEREDAAAEPMQMSKESDVTGGKGLLHPGESSKANGGVHVEMVSEEEPDGVDTEDDEPIEEDRQVSMPLDHKQHVESE